MTDEEEALWEDLRTIKDEGRRKIILSDKKDSELEAAIIKAGGNLRTTAELLGVEYHRLIQHINRRPAIKDFVTFIRSSFIHEIVDLAEEALMEKIKQGSTQEILFALKTQGKERGWGDAKDDKSGAVTITVVRAEPEPKPEGIEDMGRVIDIELPAEQREDVKQEEDDYIYSGKDSSTDQREVIDGFDR